MSGRIVVYDWSSADWLHMTWHVGAFLFQPKFDAVLGVQNVDEVFDALEKFATSKGPNYKFKEIQWWAHGNPGLACIGSTYLDYNYIKYNPKFARFKSLNLFDKDAVWWFRTCSTAANDSGRLFLKELATELNVISAGHLMNIGATQFNLVAVRPNSDPWWTDETKGTNVTFLNFTFPIDALQGH